MPYRKVSLGGGKFKVENTQTGTVHSKATTSANADAQIRLLQMQEHEGSRVRTTREVIGKHPQVKEHRRRKAKRRS